MVAPYDIKVIDRRDESHQSVGTLPLLGEDEIERLMDFYKFKFDFSLGYDKATASDHVWWGIQAIELKPGPAILQPAVFGLQGQLLAGTSPTGELYNIAGFLSYPDHSEQLDGGWQPRYFDTGNVWWTDGNGSVGLGYGQESHIGPTGGPFRLWVSRGLPPGTPGVGVGSDLAYDLGWWDDHITPNVWFRLMTKSGGTPPTTPPTGSAYLVTYDANGVAVYHTPLIPGAAPAGTSAHVVVVGGQPLYYTQAHPGSP